MNTKKITHKGKLYAIYFNVSEAEDGLSFISEDGDFIQVGIWKYQPKKTLPAHFHKEYIREATRTCESVYVVKGKIKCNLYTKSGNFIESFILTSILGADLVFSESNEKISESKFSTFISLKSSSFNKFSKLNSSIFDVLDSGLI